MSNPLKLRPTELCRLLNSTPLGEVVTPATIYRHRTRAGHRIGDSKFVDLLRYVCWLVMTLMAAAGSGGKKPKKDGSDPGYEKHKQRTAERERNNSRAGRDIGDLPPVVDQARRDRAERDLRFFLETYLSATFNLKWSKDHLEVIAKIEESVLKGGLFALAMPRGSGKSSLCEGACIWAMLFGHRNFVALIGATAKHAEDSLTSIKTEFEANDLLLEDFPESVFPIRCLEGIANRCSGQLYQGERTRIVWKKDTIVLPSIAGARSSGAIIKVAGITGQVRGMKFKRWDGTTARPQLVIVDDPQTEESAESITQCNSRERTLAKAVLGLAGPKTKIAGVMPCTVIFPGDVADRLLNRDLYPVWNGARMRMLKSFPANMDLWEKYRDIRNDSLRKGRLGVEATTFYLKHRKKMDQGAEVSWPERFNDDEVSGIQHAMNWYLTDRAAFLSECQNAPEVEALGSSNNLTADLILEKVNNTKRGSVPRSTAKLTCFVDVGKYVHWWMVCGWDELFGGNIIDYGCWPIQNRANFAALDARPSLIDAYPNMTEEARLFKSLNELTTHLLTRDFLQLETAAPMRIERCLIDAGAFAEQIYEFCRISKFAGSLLPSKGYAVKKGVPIDEWKKIPGQSRGPSWRLATSAERAGKLLTFDPNYWKSFVADRLLTPLGTKGTLMLPGASRDEREMLLDHLTCEYRTADIHKGRVFDVWETRPGRSDNHWFDCLVGNAVTASLLGIRASLTGDVVVKPKRKVIDIGDLYRDANGKGGQA